ncbi:MAG TPA: PilZ domain-containing protein [Sphingobium sp.]
MGYDMEEEPSTRRGATRHSFFLLANVIDEDGSVIGRLRVRNLSASGLMGDTELELEPQARLTVDLRGIGSVSGTIAWAREGKIGMAFDVPVNPQQALKPVGRGRKIGQ